MPEKIMRSDAQILEKLDRAIGLLAKKGIDRDWPYERALIMPACGLGMLPVRAAECADGRGRRIEASRGGRRN